MTIDVLSDLMDWVDKALWDWEKDCGARGPDIKDPQQFQCFLNGRNRAGDNALSAAASGAGPADGNGDELAATAAVLLVIGRDTWSPPQHASAALRQQLLLGANEVRHLLTTCLPADPQRFLWAPEFACAYFLGWPDRQVNWKSRGLDGIPGSVRYLVLEYLEESVGSCLAWLKGHVIGFPADEQPLAWAERVLNRLLAQRGGCMCWMRAADLAPGAVDPDTFDFSTLRGNAKRKARTCLTQHRLRAWDPRMPLDPGRAAGEKWTLWRFLQRAAKGFLGGFRSGQLPTGMFWDCWQTDAEKYRGNTRLMLAKVARYHCPQCGAMTFGRSCSNRGGECRGWPLGPEGTWTELVRSWIILADPIYGGWKTEKVWVCRQCQGVRKMLENRRTGPIRDDHDNIYLVRTCRDGCPPDGRHDSCPLCGREHSRGRGHDASTVYFLQ